MSDACVTLSKLRESGFGSVPSFDSRAPYSHALRIRKWAIAHNITHDALGDLLSCLKVDHPELPLDPRTLKATPRSTDVINLNNGGYTHVGLVNGLKRRLLGGLKGGSVRTVQFWLPVLKNKKML